MTLLVVPAEGVGHVVLEGIRYDVHAITRGRDIIVDVPGECEEWEVTIEGATLTIRPWPDPESGISFWDKHQGAVLRVSAPQGITVSTR